MKQRRPLPWKRLLFGFLGVFLLVQFYMEYFWIAVFCSVVPVIVLLRMGYEFWKGRRKARRIEGEQVRRNRRRWKHTSGIPWVPFPAGFRGRRRSDCRMSKSYLLRLRGMSLAGGL